MAFDNMAAGNKVYNGGSNVAQRSQTLDPSGYIRRGLLQKAAERRLGSSGGTPVQQGAPSEQRSGIAQSALQAQGGQGPATPPAQPFNVGGLAPLNLSSQQAQQGVAQAPWMSQTQAFNASAPPPMSSKAPTVKLPGVPSSITGALKSPLDRDLRTRREQEYNALNETMTALQSALEQMSSEYQQTLRDMNIDRQQGYGNLAAQFAAMGGGPGTAYGTEFSDLTRDFTNFRNDLDTQFTRGQQDLLKDRTSGVTRFQTALRDLVGTQTERDVKKRAEKALKTKTKVKAKPKPKKKPAAKKASSNYKIRRGDTLSAIAKRYGTTVSKLAKLNNISNPNRIIAGKTLRLK